MLFDRYLKALPRPASDKKAIDAAGKIGGPVLAVKEGKTDKWAAPAVGALNDPAKVAEELANVLEGTNGKPLEDAGWAESTNPVLRHLAGLRPEEVSAWFGDSVAAMNDAIMAAKGLSRGKGRGPSAPEAWRQLEQCADCKGRHVGAIPAGSQSHCAPKLAASRDPKFDVSTWNASNKKCNFIQPAAPGKGVECRGSGHSAQHHAAAAAHRAAAHRVPSARSAPPRASTRAYTPSTRSRRSRRATTTVRSFALEIAF